MQTPDLSPLVKGVIAIFCRGRPAEVFLSSWGKTEKNEMRAIKLEAVLTRRKKNLAPSC